MAAKKDKSFNWDFLFQKMCPFSKSTAENRTAEIEKSLRLDFLLVKVVKPSKTFGRGLGDPWSRKLTVRHGGGEVASHLD